MYPEFLINVTKSVGKVPSSYISGEANFSNSPRVGKKMKNGGIGNGNVSGHKKIAIYHKRAYWWVTMNQKKSQLQYGTLSTNLYML